MTSEALSWVNAIIRGAEVKQEEDPMRVLYMSQGEHPRKCDLGVLLSDLGTAGMQPYELLDIEGAMDISNFYTGEHDHGLFIIVSLDRIEGTVEEHTV